jgi:hypothetical protein
MPLLQCSLRITEEKLGNRQVFLSGINGSNRARMSKSQRNTILITFFDINCTAHFEFRKVKQSMKLIIKWLLPEDVDIKGKKFGLTIGFSTMTKLQLTRRSLPSSL